MFSFLLNFFAEKKIDCFAPIPLAACRIVRPYLLERNGIGNEGTVIMMAIPYYTSACNDPSRNLSAYAVPRDYHAFYRALFEELIPSLQKEFTDYHFAGFADHSPIAETEAASRAGLGVIGKNHLLLTKKYSSYVFLGEIVTDMKIPCVPVEVAYCKDCGACTKACPMEDCGGCLSALTQKKGTLTEKEVDSIRKYGSVWGCDICQDVCPYTQKAKLAGTIYSPISFFNEFTISHLTSPKLLKLTDEEFLQRAFSWRGKETVLRNLALFETNEKGGSSC